MPRLLLLNHVVLLLCCSIYLGTGVSLVLFMAPLSAASHFFTTMTVVMLICGLIMLATEWLSGLRWVPVVVLAAVIVATVLTSLAGRFALWIIEWAAMAYWFYRLALLARADR
jgi:hypothetical protein